MFFEIFCNTLFFRYCTNLEQNVCGVLYPIYDINKIDPELNYFVCNLRLPPNSVLNKTIRVCETFQ